MATRSSIAVKHGNNIKAVYCHWDGYLSHNGKILLESYDSPKANYLVALGDISSLGKRIEPLEGTDHSFQNPQEDVCVFYGRDRKEEGGDFRTFGSEAEWLENLGQEYNYLMDGGVWYVSTPDNSNFIPLFQALAEEISKELDYE
jgi:hypothetical protein